MNVYDVDGNFIAHSLRAAAEILNVSHVTVKNYCEQRDGAYYLTTQIGSKSVGRPKDVHTTHDRDTPRYAGNWWEHED